MLHRREEIKAEERLDSNRAGETPIEYVKRYLRVAEHLKENQPPANGELICIFQRGDTIHR